MPGNASNFMMYERAKQRLLDGSFDLDGDQWWIALFQSGSNCTTLTAGVCDDYDDLTHEVPAGAGYVTGGIALTNPLWVNTAGTMRFLIDDAFFLAVGGTITARYAVIYNHTHAQKGLLCWCLLDVTPADISAGPGSEIDILMPPTGIFTLSGMTTP